jgi:hypothetical protein
MNHINIFFRHVFECASLCSSEFECSAFYFNAKEKNCQLGKKDEINIALSSTPANSIPIHINEDYTFGGMYVTVNSQWVS